MSIFVTLESKRITSRRDRLYFTISCRLDVLAGCCFCAGTFSGHNFYKDLNPYTVLQGQHNL